VYGIQPWNFPAYQAIRYSIASLMAGNGVLLKHAEICTGSGLLLRDIYESAGLPKGLFGVLLISHDQSNDIVENDLVRAVTLTGSETAGRTVAAKAGAALKKTVLELGSNDAYLVLDDADLDLAVDTCVKGRLFNNGQTCVNAKRFIVTQKNYDAFVSAYASKFEAIKMGDPNAADTQLGPLVSKAQRDKLHEQVTKSVSQGARLLVGGEVPDRTGWFYPATVLADVAPGQVAYEDEQPLWPGRRHFQSRREARPRAGHQVLRYRHDLHQHLRRCLPGAALRWGEGLRLRPRARPGRPQGIR
jgi:succinate-semialdehyde dehydrogenase/glutarate-semialdehyde dehydrogenase